MIRIKYKSPYGSIRYGYVVEKDEVQSVLYIVWEGDGSKNNATFKYYFMKEGNNLTLFRMYNREDNPQPIIPLNASFI